MQVVYEEAYFHLLRALAGRYDVRRLCVAGVCGANSVANTPAEALDCFRRTNMDVLVLGDTIVARP